MANKDPERRAATRRRIMDACWDVYAAVTVNYSFAKFTNPTHHFHQRSFANSTNGYLPFLAPSTGRSVTSGSRSFMR